MAEDLRYKIESSLDFQGRLLNELDGPLNEKLSYCLQYCAMLHFIDCNGAEGTREATETPISVTIELPEPDVLRQSIRAAMG
jgi:hypothetical protein